jgi:hypothetical protein
MHYKKFIPDNENIKRPTFLWQGNLPNWARKTNSLLAGDDIHLRRASGQVLSYTSEVVTMLFQQLVNQMTPQQACSKLVNKL